MLILMEVVLPLELTYPTERQLVSGSGSYCLFAISPSVTAPLLWFLIFWLSCSRLFWILSFFSNSTVYSMVLIPCFFFVSRNFFTLVITAGFKWRLFETCETLVTGGSLPLELFLACSVPFPESYWLLTDWFCCESFWETVTRFACLLFEGTALWENGRNPSILPDKYSFLISSMHCLLSSFIWMTVLFSFFFTAYFEGSMMAELS